MPEQSQPVAEGPELNDADPMLNAIAAYLKTKGWNVVVIGSPRVQKPLEEAEFNYEFVVRFTGSPPKGLDEDLIAGRRALAGERRK